MWDVGGREKKGSTTEVHLLVRWWSVKRVNFSDVRICRKKKKESRVWTGSISRDLFGEVDLVREDVY